MTNDELRDEALEQALKETTNVSEVVSDAEEASSTESDRHETASDSEGAVDNFGDVAAKMSDATSKVAESAKNAAEQASVATKAAAAQMTQVTKNAAGQVSQATKSAADQMSQTAKKAKGAAMLAGAQAAVKAEQNLANKEQTADKAVPESFRKIVSQAWAEYLATHTASVLYTIAGAIVGLCILWFGFWPVLLVLATTYGGLTYGRYRDGDVRVVSFLKRYFDDDE